jgi:hypothetical protein
MLMARQARFVEEFSVSCSAIAAVITFPMYAKTPSSRGIPIHPDDTQNGLFQVLIVQRNKR